MKLRIAILALAAATAGVLVGALRAGDGSEAHSPAEAVPGKPSVSVISPRNGSTQPSKAVAVHAQPLPALTIELPEAEAELK